MKYNSNTKQSVYLDLGNRSYHIHIGKQMISEIHKLLPDNLANKKCCIISDTTVYSLYGKKITRLLKLSGTKLIDPFLLPPGESSKNPSNLFACYDHLLHHEMDRQSFLVILGGGVPGDLGGFAAATYMRGIPFIFIPTTLMAQTDASVGGKTGINLPSGKNLVGAFHQPSLVLIDIDLLDTLPKNHWKNGMAEIIKMAVLGDPELFACLESTGNKIYHEKKNILQSMITSCCKLKSNIISQDEKEKNIRATLNLGHTIGHALEASTNFSVLLHGEAVALGLIAVARISLNIGLIDTNDFTRIHSLVQSLQLPVNVKNISKETIIDHLKWDKKTENKELHFILPTQIGEVVIRNDISKTSIQHGLREILV